jgi:hypothetical protein
MTLKHRMSMSAEYRAWSSMRERCGNPSHPAYDRYGGRGIRVAPEWDTATGGFEAFLAHVGPRPKGKFDIDRRDNERGYEPGNVRWATRKENSRNRRGNRMIVVRGETATLAEWAERSGLSPETVAYRLRSGYSAEDALKMTAGEGNFAVGKKRARARSTNHAITVDGVALCAAEWAERSGAKADTILHRLRRGWSPRDAVFGRASGAQ